MSRDDLPAHSLPGTLPPVRPQELEVLALLTVGASNKVIARVTGKSLSAVNVHVQCLMRRNRATNRVELAYLAGRGGWLR